MGRADRVSLHQLNNILDSAADRGLPVLFQAPATRSNLVDSSPAQCTACLYMSLQLVRSYSRCKALLERIGSAHGMERALRAVVAVLVLIQVYNGQLSGLGLKAVKHL